MRTFALALLLLPAVALAQTQQYLPEPSVAVAQARSAMQCTALGCDGVNTKYWWQVVALQNKTAAVQIDVSSDAYGVTARTAKATAGLTPEEQAKLVPYRAECLARLLAWCIATKDFQARFSVAETTELDKAAAPCGTYWASISRASVVDMQARGPSLATACTEQGLAYDWRTILAPMPVEVVPP